MKKPRTRVFHARDRFARGFSNPWPVWPVDYDYVADVATDNPDVAMKMTQSGEEFWQSNRNVRAYRPARRSTSPGDVFILPDGYILFVSNFGFDVIGMADLSE